MSSTVSTVHWAQLHGHVTRRKMQCVTRHPTPRRHQPHFLSPPPPPHCSPWFSVLFVCVCARVKSCAVAGVKCMKDQCSKCRYIHRTSASVPSVPRQCGDQQLMCRWELLLAACAGLAAVSEPELGWQTTLHHTPHTRRCTQHTFWEHSHYCCSPAIARLPCSLTAG